MPPVARPGKQIAVRTRRRTMTTSDLVYLNREESPRSSLTMEEGRRRLIAVWARAGVWGMIVGFGSILFGSVAPILAFFAAGTGFFVGGLGTLGTCVLVLKHYRKASVPLRLAAVVGLPFGASLMMFVSGAMWGWPLPVIVVALSIPTAAILGPTMMLLLLIGFLVHAITGRGSEAVKRPSCLMPDVSRSNVRAVVAVEEMVRGAAGRGGGSLKGCGHPFERARSRARPAPDTFLPANRGIRPVHPNDFDRVGYPGEGIGL
jgi:hypothetical protein